jgi:hypothetical protein
VTSAAAAAPAAGAPATAAAAVALDHAAALADPAAAPLAHQVGAAASEAGIPGCGQLLPAAVQGWESGQQRLLCAWESRPLHRLPSFAHPAKFASTVKLETILRALLGVCVCPLDESLQMTSAKTRNCLHLASLRLCWYRGLRVFCWAVRGSRQLAYAGVCLQMQQYILKPSSSAIAEEMQHDTHSRSDLTAGRTHTTVLQDGASRFKFASGGPLTFSSGFGRGFCPQAPSWLGSMGPADRSGQNRAMWSCAVPQAGEIRTENPML